MRDLSVPLTQGLIFSLMNRSVTIQEQGDRHGKMGL